MDDLWYRCNVVNFDFHISNVVGCCMCGVAGDTLICCSKGKKKPKNNKQNNKQTNKKTQKNIRPCCEDNAGRVNAIYKLVH